jgi:phosphate transport system permease protein
LADLRLKIKSTGARLLDAAEPVITALIHLCGWSAILFVASIFFFIIREAIDWEHVGQADYHVKVAVSAVIATAVGLAIGSRLGLKTRAGYIGWGIALLATSSFLFILSEEVDLKAFFFTNDWIPTPAEGNEPKFGALAMIYGTFSITVFSMFLAIPLGLGSAIYISEFAGPKTKETLKILIELLAAIPSIVWGFIGLLVIGPMLGGVSLLTAGIIIALMAVPMIVSISEDALRAVPDSFREAAIALGASRWEMVRRVLFPAAKNGLLAACMLGVGRAVGETMAVLMASGNADQIPGNFFNPGILLMKVKTLTATIVGEMNDTVHGDEHYRMLFVIGLLLLIITVVINVTSDIIVKGIGKKLDG